MKKLLTVNGPNLNLLGEREPEIYGRHTMDDCLAQLRRQFPQAEFDYYQSNVEGELINRLQQTLTDGTEGILLNAGGYTHTSVAIHDCLRALRVPVVEVHLSNPQAREPFRQTSLIGPACVGTVAGFGMQSYLLAAQALLS